MAEKESPGTNSSESDGADAEFEPTADMLVHDFDDERTMEEEEAMEEGSDQEEVNNLQKEQDMPLQQVLAMYGAYPTEESAIETNGDAGVEEMDEDERDIDGEGDENEGDDGDAAISHSSDENMNLDKDETDLKPERRKKEKSDLVQLYPELDANGDTGATASSRSLRSGSRQQSEDEEEEEGECSGEEEEDWRKTIMIGSAYQAQVPEGLQEYGATPPYENEDKLLWEPGRLTPKQVEEYLRVLHQPPSDAQGVATIPLGRHVRDDEQALHLLLQCGYNVEEALRRHRMNPTPLASTMTLWSEEECRNFENGVKTYGKNFHLVQQNKVRTRSVGELVQFYYLWKKTERHDMFAAKTRLEKKKYIVHPGTTDYMDRFLDEGETPPTAFSVTGSVWRENNNRSSSPCMHTLLYGRPQLTSANPSSVISLSNSQPESVNGSSVAHRDEGLSSLQQSVGDQGFVGSESVSVGNIISKTPTTTMSLVKGLTIEPKPMVKTETMAQ